jgi:hypothetical protein
VLFVAAILLLHGRLETERSQKALVRAYALQRPSPESRLIYFRDRPDSAQFYSLGRAQTARDAVALNANLDGATTDFFAIRDRDLAALPPLERARLDEVGSYGDYRLLREARR